MSLPLIAVTLNLRAFSIDACDDYEQSIIGRAVRSVSPADLTDHPRRNQLCGALRALGEQRAIIIESAANDVVPVLERWATHQARVNSVTSHNEAAEIVRQRQLLTVGTAAHQSWIVGASAIAAVDAPAEEHTATGHRPRKRRLQADDGGTAVRRGRVVFTPEIHNAEIAYSDVSGLVLGEGSAHNLSADDRAYIANFHEQVRQAAIRRQHVLRNILRPTGRWWPQHRVVASILKAWDDPSTAQSQRKLATLLCVADHQNIDSQVETRTCGSGDVEYRIVV